MLGEQEGMIYIIVDNARYYRSKVVKVFLGENGKIVYTTNAVEGFHRQVRKVTKAKGAFTNDMALLKPVYLATKNIEKKWTSPLHNWSLTIQQLYIKFGNRIPLTLNTNSSEASPRGIETTDRV